MKPPVEGSKEFQIRGLRLKRAAGERTERIQTAAKAAKPISAPVPASAQQQETTMKKAKKKPAKPTAKKRSRSEASANLKAAKRGRAAGASKSKIVTAENGISKPGAPVPALDVANFMARPVGHKDAPLGGASMAELVEKFGIEAHPMRAKIHYVRHKLGWTVETKEGRYFATAPKAKAA